MTRTARILITITIIAVITARTNSSADAETPIPSQPLGEATPLSATEAELLAASADLFHSNGMDLPDGLVASFHDDEADCEDMLGLFTVEEDGPRVRVCWTHDDPGVQRRLQEQALVHELAHAWVDSNVSDGTREEFVVLTEAETWNSRSSEWNDRGTERAADLITWALLDPAVLFVDFASVPCETWIAAFELITSSPTPVTLTGAC